MLPRGEGTREGEDRYTYEWGPCGVGESTGLVFPSIRVKRKIGSREKIYGLDGGFVC